MHLESLLPRLFIGVKVAVVNTIKNQKKVGITLLVVSLNQGTLCVYGKAYYTIIGKISMTPSVGILRNKGS